MRTSDRILHILFWSIVLLGIIDRLLILQLTIGYASDDLTVIWLAAQDYSRGIFHEPFFYGQNYGVMLEALLAAPLVAFGADPIIAVPVVIAFIAMAPFWSFAFYYFLRKEYVGALLFAALPLLLPPEHGIQYTNLNGLAVLAICPWVQRIRNNALSAFLIGLVLTAAAAVNLNALVACAAFGTWFLFTQSKKPELIGWAALGTVPVLAGFWAAMHFYAQRPEAVMNTVFDWRFVFHGEGIPIAFGQLDAHFAWLFPIWWPNEHLVLWALVAIEIMLYRRGKKANALGLLAALVVIVLAMGFPKAHDGTGSVFFPLSRIFLAAPLLLGWGISQLDLQGKGRKFFVTSVGPAVVICFILRFVMAPGIFASALANQEQLPLRVWPVELIREQCRMIRESAIESDTEVVVLLRVPDPQYAQFMAMGCPVCEESLPPTYMPDGDRRDWRRAEESMTTRTRILVVNGDPTMWHVAMNGSFRVEELRATDPAIHLVLDPGFPVDECVARIKKGLIK